MFHAIGRSLNKSAAELRSVALSWASVPGQRLNGETVTDWIQWNFNIAPAKYLETLSRNGEWGGASEIGFLVNALNIIVCVYESSGPTQAKKKYEFFPDVRNDKTRAVCILYTGNHYMQIVLEKS
jgi:hypothetical protein